MMYKDGLGVKRNKAEAVRLFKLSAQKENDQAQYELGFMYYKGKGVARDRDKEWMA